MKLWLYLQIFKSAVASSYIIQINLAQTLFLLENFHISYWVNLRTFGVIVEFFTSCQVYCGRCDFTKLVYFPINCLSWLDFISYVDILSVTTKTILKCFLILSNRLKFCTTPIWMSEYVLFLSDWNCGTVSLSET